MRGLHAASVTIRTAREFAVHQRRSQRGSLAHHNQLQRSARIDPRTTKAVVIPASLTSGKGQAADEAICAQQVAFFVAAAFIVALRDAQRRRVARLRGRPHERLCADVGPTDSAAVLLMVGGAMPSRGTSLRNALMVRGHVQRSLAHPLLLP
mmetsp:Transcript_3935/g.9191  ORF Transcript_3935/g.9191 Transcript_3935/m.9191 type:complete len:152 (-) Transcript_3935:201-656(-)